MKDSRLKRRLFVWASWLIVVALVFASVSLWIKVPSGSGPVASLVGVLGSQIVYATVYLTEAALLAFSMWRKKKRLRRNTFLVVYLTGFATTLLTLMVTGIDVKIVDNLVFSILAALCWIYWKFKTEYINPKDFEGHIEELGERPVG